MTRMSYNRRHFIKAAGVAGVAGLAGCIGGGNGGSSNVDSDATEWSFGITREGTIGYVKATGWARVFDEADTDISLTLNTTGGSEEAYRLTAAGDNHITRGTSAMGMASYNEESRPGANFGGESAIPTVPQQVMAVSDLRPFWVTLDDSIQSIEDLEGKTVHNGAAGSRFVGAIPFDSVGMLSNMELVQGDWSDIPFALEEGRVDAAYCYVMASGTSLPGWAEQLANQDSLRVLPFSDSQYSTFEEDPYLNVREVPVNEVFPFETNVDTVKSPTSQYQWYVHPDLSNENVKEFCEISFNNVSQLQEVHDALGLFNEEYAVSGMTKSPVHPGAVEWYKENDLWNDDLIEG
ncbi:TAXI family TRAP transporter solute-binding subunit [Natrinema caseinilyticum]|uniref:TAXI family TRAP transporter solute-binding subunit n=1 Tax=Natrinema caseinilyticum TaxID=2961570 RepID=UPI0020C3C835|nr:TAXI family TRAP transporter solute-binding subunit [Natrinema caseinilyticum]